jgi:hypothetical protein
MRAKEFISLVWSKAVQDISRLLFPIIIFFLLPGFLNESNAQPVVTVRFANPEFICTTQTYSLDVEFQCNTASKQLFGMNVRFFYPDNVLEFLSFGEFVSGYGIFGTTGISTGSSTSGMTNFGFPGPSEYVNGAIQKIGSSSLTLSTTGWTKIFNVSFHVDDPNAMTTDSFCPSVIWDLNEPATGGIGPGIIITIVNNGGSTGAIEHCVQFNWAYDGNYPTLPHGYPAPTNCLDPNCVIAPDTYLPILGLCNPGNVDIPVTVTDFEAIGAFSLAFEYDPAVLTYLNNTPNSIFNATNGLLTVTDLAGNGSLRKITLGFDGNAISLADNEHLTDLHFTYISGTSNMTWKTDGTSCKYYDVNNNTLYDQPYSDYYHSGVVVSTFAPVTKIDSAVAVEGNFVTYSVRVWDFINIHSGLLTLTYDPGVLVYQGSVPNTALAASFMTDFLSPGLLTFTWTGDASLADESVLVYLTFQYLGGSAPLSWSDNGSNSCIYVNCILNQPLNDEPTEEFYINGNVTNADFIWTGQVSNDWNTGSNWVNNVVPNEYTNVTIDPVATRNGWPTFDGDFTLGVQCKNLILAGDAQFTVTGDLTINPGHTLDITGSGILQIGGNWTNSGIFNPGTGTIEFIGDENGTIAEGVPPGNYVAAYILSTFGQGMTLLTGGTAGPTGDNVSSTAAIGFTFNYLGVSYTQAKINTNGWLSLNLSGTDATSSDNTSLFNTNAPTTALAPWWDDLKADASTFITYKTEGSVPNRVFTAQWKDILAYSSVATARLNFQVKLYETTNVIEFLYGNVSGTVHNSNEGASIGIKDATGGFGNFLEATRNSTNIILSFLQSTTDWPQLNYRFTPPVASEIDTFYRVIASKTVSTLTIARDVLVLGVE